MVDEARLRGARITTHSNTSVGIERVVLAGVDSVEHCPGEPNEKLANLMAERGTFHTPTMHTRDRWARRLQNKERTLPQPIVDCILKERDGNMTFLQQGKKAGMKLVCGSDSGIAPEYGTSARELEIFVECGYTPREALATATTTAAESFGVPGQIGVLAPGALADFVIMKKDPAKNIYVLREKGNIIQVYRSGLTLDPLG